jgi:hypothetical protein
MLVYVTNSGRLEYFGVAVFDSLSTWRPVGVAEAEGLSTWRGVMVADMERISWTTRTVIVEV